MELEHSAEEVDAKRVRTGSGVAGGAMTTHLAPAGFSEGDDWSEPVAGAEGVVAMVRRSARLRSFLRPGSGRYARARDSQLHHAEDVYHVLFVPIVCCLINRWGGIQACRQRTGVDIHEGLFGLEMQSPRKVTPSAQTVKC